MRYEDSKFEIPMAELDVFPGGMDRQHGPARSAYEKAAKSLARAHGEVDRLLRRVEPALGPDNPLPPSEDKAGPEAPTSEVTGSFLTLAFDADRLARRLSNITSRVEL